MKIIDVEVIEIAITRLPGIRRFIREYTTTGPMDSYGEYANNRAMWTGGGDIILPIVIVKTDENIEGYGFCGGFTSASGEVIIKNHNKNEKFIFPLIHQFLSAFFEFYTSIMESYQCNLLFLL